MRTPRARYGTIAVLAALSFGVAACGDDEADTSNSSADSESMTSESMTSEPMTSESMTSEPMTSEPMTSEPGEMMEPSGPACSSIPADGEGSFSGMADDPAATAASNNPELSTLVAAVTAAGLGDTLNGEGPFTIFAPANSAFDKIPAADLDAVLADTDLLTSILTLHVVGGQQLSSTDLAGMESVETVNGESITLAMEGDALMVNGQASVVCADIPTSNATVHIIDTVMMPMGGGEEPMTSEPMTSEPMTTETTTG